MTQIRRQSTIRKTMKIGNISSHRSNVTTKQYAIGAINSDIDFSALFAVKNKRKGKNRSQGLYMEHMSESAHVAISVMKEISYVGA